MAIRGLILLVAAALLPGQLQAAPYASANGVADTDPVSDFPASTSINGLGLVGDDIAWFLGAGYRIRPFFAVEIAYADLGRFDSAYPNLSGSSRTALAIEEWTMAARFKAPIYGQLSATWCAGLLRATFDVNGAAPIFGGFPVPTVVGEVPYADPDDETGWFWGFGFAYAMTDRTGIGLIYRRHDTRVIDVETIGLEFTVSL